MSKSPAAAAATGVNSTTGRSTAKNGLIMSQLSNRTTTNINPTANAARTNTNSTSGELANKKMSAEPPASSNGSSNSVNNLNSSSISSSPTQLSKKLTTRTSKVLATLSPSLSPRSEVTTTVETSTTTRKFWGRRSAPGIQQQQSPASSTASTPRSGVSSPQRQASPPQLQSSKSLPRSSPSLKSRVTAALAQTTSDRSIPETTPSPTSRLPSPRMVLPAAPIETSSPMIVQPVSIQQRKIDAPKIDVSAYSRLKGAFGVTSSRKTGAGRMSAVSPSPDASMSPVSPGDSTKKSDATMMSSPSAVISYAPKSSTTTSCLTSQNTTPSTIMPPSPAQLQSSPRMSPSPTMMSPPIAALSPPCESAVATPRFSPIPPSSLTHAPLSMNPPPATTENRRAQTATTTFSTPTTPSPSPRIINVVSTTEHKSEEVKSPQTGDFQTSTTTASSSSQHKARARSVKESEPTNVNLSNTKSGTTRRHYLRFTWRVARAILRLKTYPATTFAINGIPISSWKMTKVPTLGASPTSSRVQEMYRAVVPCGHLTRDGKDVRVFVKCIPINVWTQQWNEQEKWDGEYTTDGENWVMEAAVLAFLSENSTGVAPQFHGVLEKTESLNFDHIAEISASEDKNKAATSRRSVPSRENVTHIVIVSELYGEDLVDYLDRRDQMNSPLSPRSRKALQLGCLTLLWRLHRLGLAHLDFTPENILLGARGLRLCDFAKSTPLWSPNLRHLKNDEDINSRDEGGGGGRPESGGSRTNSSGIAPASPVDSFYMFESCEPTVGKGAYMPPECWKIYWRLEDERIQRPLTDLSHLRTAESRVPYYFRVCTADVYMAGVVSFWIWSDGGMWGCSDVRQDDKFEKLVRYGMNFDLFRECRSWPADLKSFLAWALNVKPWKRGSLGALSRHSWFSSSPSVVPTQEEMSHFTDDFRFGMRYLCHIVDPSLCPTPTIRAKSSMSSGLTTAESSNNNAKEEIQQCNPARIPKLVQAVKDQSSSVNVESDVRKSEVNKNIVMSKPVASSSVMTTSDNMLYVSTKSGRNLPVGDGIISPGYTPNIYKQAANYSKKSSSPKLFKQHISYAVC